MTAVSKYAGVVSENQFPFKDAQEEIINSLKEMRANPENSVYSHSMAKEGKRKHPGEGALEDILVTKEIYGCLGFMMDFHGQLATCIKAGETCMQIFLKKKE